MNLNAMGVTLIFYGLYQTLSAKQQTYGNYAITHDQLF